MLKILDKPEFETTVRVNTAHLVGEFNATFIALKSSELVAAGNAALAAGLGPQGVLFTVCRGFDQVQMPDGSRLSYERLTSPDGGAMPAKLTGKESLEMLLDVPGIGPAMTKAYYRALWEEAAGN